MIIAKVFELEAKEDYSVTTDHDLIVGTAYFNISTESSEVDISMDFKYDLDDDWLQYNIHDISESDALVDEDIDELDREVFDALIFSLCKKGYPV